jgi:hypothetical protein
MLKTVKKTMHDIGDGTGYFAKRVGSETADLAKRVGSETAELAKRIGPKRAIIGIAVIGVVVGGSIFLVRYLRARKEKEEMSFEGAEQQMEGGAVRRRHKRGADAQFSH